MKSTNFRKTFKPEFKEEDGVAKSAVFSGKAEVFKSAPVATMNRTEPKKFGVTSPQSISTKSRSNIVSSTSVTEENVAKVKS